jgi:hypothetical protein
MHAIVEFLRAQVAAEIVPHPAGEHAVQLFHTGVVAGADPLDKICPIDRCGCSGRGYRFV